MKHATTHLIWIDYSGAGHREQTLSRSSSAIAVCLKNSSDLQVDISTGWSRARLTQWLSEFLSNTHHRCMIGVDYGLSLPLTVQTHIHVDHWDQMCQWLIDYVGSNKNTWRWREHLSELEYAYGISQDPKIFRCCDSHAKTAKSVVNFRQKQGNVAFSTHAGLLELGLMFQDSPQLRQRCHIWPFDGWTPPEKKHVFFEAYPRVYRQYGLEEISESTSDRRDAHLIVSRLEQALDNNELSTLFHPHLPQHEQSVAKREGWIFAIPAIQCPESTAPVS